MYEFIEGTLENIFPTHIVINVHGIGFKIYCPNPFVFKEYLKQEIVCYVEQVVREDSITLYGFKTVEEKDLFNVLNKVSGIGPKSALSILAVGDNQGLIHAIDQSDIVYLTKFPGVGKKTAQQIILDLSGKLSTTVETNAVDTNNRKQMLEDMNEALIGLGYSRREITRVMSELKSTEFANTQEGLSLAFKLLLK